jgi:UDP-N-acetylmuramyl pentapeptide synthase
MYLALKDLASLFSESRGVKDDFMFVSVTDMANEIQPKGLFVSLNKESGELSEAIENGAIAAVWDVENKLPAYTPNHFPIFFTNDPATAIVGLLSNYLQKLNGEIDKKMEITNFKFSRDFLLNKNSETYDIAVMIKKVTNLSVNTNERRG